jgi:RNA polymerase sigma-54 factor
MTIELGLGQMPSVETRVTPKQIVANKVLAMSSAQLQETIAQELDENPALEMVEEATCPTCGALLRGPVCLECGPRPAQHADADLPPSAGSMASLDDAADDPIARAEAPFTLEEHLTWNLRTVLPPALHPVAAWVAGAIDDDGFLTATDAQIAEATGSTVSDAARVRKALRGMEPIGIGARDATECLLIQIAYLREQGDVEVPKIAERLVHDHLAALGARHIREIARALGVSVEDVEAAAEFVRSHLHPYPASAFVAATSGDAPRPILRPDVLIREVDGELIAEVVESRSFTLRLAASYAEASAALRSGTWSEAEKEHVRAHVGRARFFIDAVRRRRATLQRITNSLLERQREYLLHGVRHLVPLTRAEVAAEIGVHESTVSRATAEKYVMLPSGEVVPFDHFFTASLSVKDRIREMIAHEDSPHPRSDQEIADALMAEGIVLARRTVAKYREELQILPARLRHG